MVSEPNPLVRLAIGRAEADPFFFGFALAIYRTVEELDDAGFARRLGCAPADLPRLALCRRPVSSDASFDDDVRRIGAWVHADPHRLVNVLRFAEGVEAVRRAPPRAAGGVLLAARDVDGQPDSVPRAEPGTSNGAESPAADERGEPRDA
jgi:hypothetical protein